MGVCFNVYPARLIELTCPLPKALLRAFQGKVSSHLLDSPLSFQVESFTSELKNLFGGCSILLNLNKSLLDLAVSTEHRVHRLRRDQGQDANCKKGNHYQRDRTGFTLSVTCFWLVEICKICSYKSLTSVCGV